MPREYPVDGVEGCQHHSSRTRRNRKEQNRWEGHCPRCARAVARLRYAWTSLDGRPPPVQLTYSGRQFFDEITEAAKAVVAHSPNAGHYAQIIRRKIARPRSDRDSYQPALFFAD